MNTRNPPGGQGDANLDILGITYVLHDPPCIPVLEPLFHHTDGRGMLAQ